MQFSYNIKLDAATEAEALKKMTALVAIASRLHVEDLAKIAHTLQHDPIKTAIAKKYLAA